MNNKSSETKTKMKIICLIHERMRRESSPVQTILDGRFHGPSPRNTGLLRKLLRGSGNS